MRVIRGGDFRQMPWRNGGGVTMEVAAAPDGAALDAFDWRVSLARVEQSGPFSAFPGVDRTLAVLDGEGIVLDDGKGEAVRLTRETPPYSFPGEAAVVGTLFASRLADLLGGSAAAGRRGAIRRASAASSPGLANAGSAATRADDSAAVSPETSAVSSR